MRSALKKLRLITAGLWLLLLPGAQPADGSSALLPPAPAREYRAAWVATLANIDWPSQPGLTAGQQQAELLALIRRAVELKLNTLILQVRPECDALYPSRQEPWSEFLTGQMGRAPQPWYDPLAFAVTEAHRRGLELHAWFNPFRARHAPAKLPAASSHVSRSRPEWVVKYGKQLWLDPGLPSAREYSLGVIMEVVNRYDIDGVHLDDYFYPYPEKGASGKPIPFPDDASWRAYVKRGGALSREDWRRRNVNQFVETLYRSVKASKPWVKVGISPFGIWRKGYPSTVVGLDAYAELSADSRLWLGQGWVDYLAPQLYWPIADPQKSYPVLLRWWVGQNLLHRHVCAGICAARVETAGWSPNEIVSQVRLTGPGSGTAGQVLWHMSTLMNPGSSLAAALARQCYTQPALVPACPWLSQKSPVAPRIKLGWESSGREIRITWDDSTKDTVRRWVLQTRTGKSWTIQVLPLSQTRAQVPYRSPQGLVQTIAVTAVDRYGQTSQPAVAEVKPQSTAP